VLVQELELVGCADVRAGLLSGGNKRKLSVAQAMVGDPPIIILDEPSTGQQRRTTKQHLQSLLSKRSPFCVAKANVSIAMRSSFISRSSMSLGSTRADASCNRSRLSLFSTTCAPFTNRFSYSVRSS
jgi:ABC-type uncharacterized transport system fused permease/ATPase subunit